METEQPTEDWAGRFVRVASLAVGATAIGAALAFYLGWRYEKAYIEEWGLPFSAFTYSPYDLMVASASTLILATLSPVAFVFGLALAQLLRSTVLTRSGNESSVKVALVVGVLGGLLVSGPIAIIVGGFQMLALVTWVFLAYVAGVTTHFARTGHSLARYAVLGLVIASAWVMIVITPSALGHLNAKRDRDHPDLLPKVEVTLSRPLGLSDEESRGSQTVTGPWRLIRANEGNLWLAPDQKGADYVVQIQSSDVAAVTYLRD